MLRYVAIGAVAGFALSVLLLSRSEPPPVVAPPPSPPPTVIYDGPAVLKERMQQRIDVKRSGPNLFNRLEAAIDAGR